jgi:hypothetical protein
MSGHFRLRPVPPIAQSKAGPIGLPTGICTTSRRSAWMPGTRSMRFHRGDHPMVVFDREGNVLRTWGEGLCSSARTVVHMAPDDTILPDRRCRPHGCAKCTLEGRVLLTIGPLRPYRRRS